jgi:hypothetical protein
LRAIPAAATMFSHGLSSRHLRDCGAQHTDFAAKDQIGTELSIPAARLWMPSI